MSTLAADSNFWDPLHDIFDFSLKFEEVILEIVPSIIGLILFLVFAHRYRLQPVYIRTSPLLSAKLVSHTQSINHLFVQTSDKHEIKLATLSDPGSATGRCRRLAQTCLQRPDHHCYACGVP